MENRPFQTTFDYLHRAAHTEDGWIHPLKDVVQGVSAEEAAWKPGPEVASIWEVVAHATPYLYDVIRGWKGEAQVEHEDWPRISDQSEAAWTRIRAELISGIDVLTEEISKVEDRDFLVPPPGSKRPRWQVIADISIHDAYHAGQIVKLRQLYAAREAGDQDRSRDAVAAF